MKISQLVKTLTRAGVSTLFLSTFLMGCDADQQSDLSGPDAPRAGENQALSSGDNDASESIESDPVIELSEADFEALNQCDTDFEACAMDLDRDNEDGWMACDEDWLGCLEEINPTLLDELNFDDEHDGECIDAEDWAEWTEWTEWTEWIEWESEPALTACDDGWVECVGPDVLEDYDAEIPQACDNTYDQCLEGAFGKLADDWNEWEFDASHFIADWNQWRDEEAEWCNAGAECIDAVIDAKGEQLTEDDVYSCDEQYRQCEEEHFDTESD